MAGRKRKATAANTKGKGKNGQVANEDTDSSINNQDSAPASPNTNPRERKLIVKFLFPGVGGRSRTTAERVPISTRNDQNPTFENSDKVSTTNSDASTQQADEDGNEQSPTFENSDTVSPPLKKIKFIIKKAEISTQPVEEDIKDEIPTFENFGTESPAVEAPKHPSQRKQKSKLGLEKPEENIKSVTDTLDATPAKSNTSAESLSVKKQKISPSQPTRKSKRVPKKSEKASADRTGSDKTDSPETRSPETGITEPSSDSETLNFAIHHPNDIFNSVDPESVIWKIFYHFSKEQVLLISSMLRKLPREACIEEYLKLIHQKAKSKRAEGKVEFDFRARFPGSGEYWKQLYDNLYENLYKKVPKLKNHIRVLGRRLKSRPLRTQRPSTADSDDDEIPINLLQHESNSHAGTSRNFSTDTINADINGMGVITSDDSNHHTMILLHLNRVIKKRQSICGGEKTLVNSTPESYYGLLRLSSKAIKNCTLRLSNVRGEDGANRPHRSLIYLKHEIAGSYKICIDFVTEQNKTFSGRDVLDKSNLVYLLCDFFRDGLTKLVRLCISTTEKSNPSREPTPQQVEDLTKDNESIAIEFVSDILVDILQRVQWDHQDDLHEQIFDGVLTLILEHVGKLLSVSIFGERILDSDNPGHISFWEISQEPTMNDCNFKLKSKYLIHIFDVVLKVLNEKKMGGKTEKLVKQTYKKIRHTLITNTLGGNLEDLRIPKQVQPNPLDLPNLEDLERYSPKWAIQCIFTMVGIADDEFEGISEAAITRAISGKSKFANRNTGTEYRFEDGAEDVITDAIELAIGDALGLGTDAENSLEYGYEDDVEPAEEFQSAVNLDPEERLERYRYPRCTRIP